MQAALSRTGGRPYGWALLAWWRYRQRRPVVQQKQRSLALRQVRTQQQIRRLQMSLAAGSAWAPAWCPATCVAALANGGR